MRPVHAVLYRKLLRLSTNVQGFFDTLEGARGVTEFNSFLRSSALPMGRPPEPDYVVEEFKHALAYKGGIPQYVRTGFRNPDITVYRKACGDELVSETELLSFGFRCLRYLSFVRSIIIKATTPAPRTDLVYNIGEIVFHKRTQLIGVIYAYTADTRQPQTWTRNSSRWFHGNPHYEVALQDGTYRYILQSELELLENSVDTFMGLLYTDDSGGGQSKEARRTLYHVIHTLFIGHTPSKLIPNPNLWRRFPDRDGRMTPEGIENITLFQRKHKEKDKGQGTVTKGRGGAKNTNQTL